MICGRERERCEVERYNTEKWEGKDEREGMGFMRKEEMRVAKWEICGMFAV